MHVIYINNIENNELILKKNIIQQTKSTLSSVFSSIMILLNMEIIPLLNNKSINSSLLKFTVFKSL